LSVEYILNRFNNIKISVNEIFYTEGFQNNILRINPVYADLNEPDKDISKLVFTGLTKYDPETKHIVPDMADVSISEDKLTYTFKLKDNIVWHDGEPVTADDVYFTIHDVVQNPDFQNPILKANFEGVEVNKIDDQTISFKLNAPNSFFITNTTVGILPKHILSDVPIEKLITSEFNKNPIGTGPYKIKAHLTTSVSQVSQIVLERFDGFYGEKPQIQNIRFYGYPTQQELIKNRNSLNAIPKLSDEAIDAIASDSRFSLYGYSLPQYNAIFINMDNSILKSDKVRQALQKAIFKDDFLANLPNTIRVETPVLNLDQDEWRYEASLDEAKKLLDDAGFKEYEYINGEENLKPHAAPSEENVESESTSTSTTSEVDTPSISIPEKRVYRKNAAGEILEFKLIARLYPEGSYKYNETQTVLNYIENKWAQAGIKLNIELYDKITLQEKIKMRDYDLLLFGQNLGYNLDLYGYWHSTQATENGLNLSNYKSFKVDTLIEAIRTTFDEEEKLEKLKELAKAIQNDIPAIFLYRPVYYYASDGKVKGIQLENMAFPSDRFCKINEWYF
jgi:peptide/nickel transport system substrate-binding protein